MGSFIKSTNFTNISYFGSYECLEKEPKRRFVAFLLHSVLINSGRTGWIFFSGECIAEEKSFASVLDAQFCSTHCNLCAAPAPQPVPCPTCAAARSPPSRELQNVEDIKIGKLDSLHKGTTKPALRAKKMTFHNSGLIFWPNSLPQVLQPRVSRESPLFVSQVWVFIAGKFPVFSLITSWQMTDDENCKTYDNSPSQSIKSKNLKGQL